MLALDAPSREECAAERTRANIPQQALVLLNDPTYVEAARALAARILKEGGADVRSRLDWAWRQALGRKPREDEVVAARAVLEKHLAQYAQDPASAKAVLQVGLAPTASGRFARGTCGVDQRGADHSEPARNDHSELMPWTSELQQSGRPC